MRKLFVTLLILLWATTTWAQPETQPLLQPGSLTYLGQFKVPDTDGTGWQTANQFTWSWTGSVGIAGPNQLYFSCHSWNDATLGIVEIPPIGGVAKVIEPCRQMPGWQTLGTDPTKRHVGGAWKFGNRHVVSAYIYYDGGHSQKKTHWFGDALTNMSGPMLIEAQNVVLGQDKHRPLPGMMAGWMGPVPQEWQAKLGGPAFTGQGALAITARTSFGPAVSIFDPAQLGTADPLSVSLLLGYPAEHQNLGPWGPVGGAWRTKLSPYYSGADQIGGMFMVPGTRSLVSIGRHGTGMPEMNGDVAYGNGTDQVALIGQQDSFGNHYVYDPSDSNKGPHAYPYEPIALAYDLNDLAAVKAGTKQPWDIQPYAAWNFGVGSPINKPGIKINGATFDPSTNRLYLTTGWTDVYVFQVTTNVVNRDCAETASAWSEWTKNGLTESRTRVWTQTQAKQGNGSECVWTRTMSPVVETETRNLPPVEICNDNIDNDGDGLVDEDCVVDIMIVCRITGTVSLYADKDSRLSTVRCDTNGTYQFTKGQTFTTVVTVPKP